MNGNDKQLVSLPGSGNDLVLPLRQLNHCGPIMGLNHHWPKFRALITVGHSDAENKKVRGLKYSSLPRRECVTLRWHWIKKKLTTLQTQHNCDERGGELWLVTHHTAQIIRLVSVCFYLLSCEQINTGIFLIFQLVNVKRDVGRVCHRAVNCD